MLLDLDLPAGYDARSADPSDAEAVMGVVAACERHDSGEVLIELEDIVSDWQRPSLDLARHSVVVSRQEELVACGEVSKGRRAEVYVLPGHRARGIGSALMRWTRDVARACGGSLVGQTIPDSLTDARNLFQGNGYEPLWTSWILQLPEGASLLDGDLPPGAQFRDFVPGRDDRCAYHIIEDAFNEWPDRQPTSYDDWEAGVLKRPGFQPWHLQLVTEKDEVVGVCNASVTAGVGWVDQIAVRRDSRGRGIAKAMLMRAFRQARAHGALRCELSTDSRTGALGLYEHVGMVVRASYVHWAKPL